MKQKLLAGILAASTLITTSGVVLAEPVYMIAQIQVDDMDKFFNQYGPAAGASLMENGAKILVATPTHKKLEGEWAGNWTVIVEFASQEMADGWYNSSDYQANAIPLRHSSTAFGNMIIVPAFAPPTK
ncbi:MAG: DUF1330 domain-containing protein [Rhizobiaceae bacterium]